MNWSVTQTIADGMLVALAFCLAVSIADSAIRAGNAWRSLHAALRRLRERGQ